MYKTISSKQLYKGKAFYFTYGGNRMIFPFKGNFTQTRKLVVVKEILDFLNPPKPYDLTDKLIKEVLFYGHVENELEVIKEVGEFSDDKRQETMIIFEGDSFFNHTKNLAKYKLVTI